MCPSYTSSEVRKLVGFSQMLRCRGSMDQLMDNDVQKLGRGSGFLPATKKTEQLSHKRKVIYLHISLIKFYAVHKGGRQYNRGRSPGTLQKKWTTTTNQVVILLLIPSTCVEANTEIDTAAVTPSPLNQTTSPGRFSLSYVAVEFPSRFCSVLDYILHHQFWSSFTFFSVTRPLISRCAYI